MGEAQQDPLCSHTGAHAVFSLQISAFRALSLVSMPVSGVGGPQHFATTHCLLT